MDKLKLPSTLVKALEIILECMLLYKNSMVHGSEKKLN